MRLFVAIDVSEELRRAISALITQIRPRVPTASWLNPDSLHLTIAFLGEQTDGEAGRIAAALTTAVAGQTRFTVQPAAAGFFPNVRAPRVGWIGLEPAAPIRALAEAVRRELRSERIAFDDKPFVPHLTICRTRSRWNPADTQRFAETFSGIGVPPFEAGEVVLFRSELRRDGAVHTAVRRVHLSGE